MYFVCIHHILLKVIIILCSVHVSDGFPKKVWMGGGWLVVSSIQVYFGFVDFFDFAK